MFFVSALRRTRAWVAAALLLGSILAPGTMRADEDPDTLASARPQGSGFKRASRMEFDERLIMGQSLKSGAIYLFERKDSEIQSMLKIRKDYRNELLAPLEPLP